MNKNKIIILIILLLPYGLYCQSSAKPILAILDFETNSVSKSDMALVVDYLSSYIMDAGTHRVIDRRQRDALLKEIGFSLSDCSDQGCQLKVGKQLSANQVIVGSIGKVEDRYIMNLKLLEVETGETIKTASKTYRSMSELLDSSKEVVDVLLGKTASAATAQQPSQGNIVSLQLQRTALQNDLALAEKRSRSILWIFEPQSWGAGEWIAVAGTIIGMAGIPTCIVLGNISYNNYQNAQYAEYATSYKWQTQLFDILTYTSGGVSLLSYSLGTLGQFTALRPEELRDQLKEIEAQLKAQGQK